MSLGFGDGRGNICPTFQSIFYNMRLRTYFLWKNYICISFILSLADNVLSSPPG